jgi:hypothetical protein
VRRRLLRLDDSKSHEAQQPSRLPLRRAGDQRGLDCRRTSCKLADMEAKEQKEPQNGSMFSLDRGSRLMEGRPPRFLWSFTATSYTPVDQVS